MTTSLHPYLNFNPGDTGKAMKFYQSILGGKLTMQTFGEAGMSKTPQDKDNVIHAELKSGDVSFMASDCPPDSTVKFGDSISLSIVGSDEAKLTEYFNKLSEGGTVNMPLEKQFWGDAFGMLTDKFGVQWMVNISSEKQK